jgi:hypothetical protein
VGHRTTDIVIDLEAVQSFTDTTAIPAAWATDILAGAQFSSSAWVTVTATVDELVDVVASTAGADLLASPWLTSRRLHALSGEFDGALRALLQHREAIDRLLCRTVVRTKVRLSPFFVALMLAMLQCKHVDVYGSDPSVCPHWQEYWRKAETASPHYMAADHLVRELKSDGMGGFGVGTHRRDALGPLVAFPFGAVTFHSGPNVGAGVSERRWSSLQQVCNHRERFPALARLATADHGELVLHHNLTHLPSTLSNVFSSLDSDNDGLLYSFDDLDDPLLHLGRGEWQREWFGQDRNYRLRVALFQEYDVDFDGIITQTEFEVVWSIRTTHARALTTMFDAFDTAGQGGLDHDAFDLFITCKTPDLSLSFADALSFVDWDYDRRISLSEFGALDIVLHTLERQAVFDSLAADEEEEADEDLDDEYFEGGGGEEEKGPVDEQAELDGVVLPQVEEQVELQEELDEEEGVEEAEETWVVNPDDFKVPVVLDSSLDRRLGDAVAPPTAGGGGGGGGKKGGQGDDDDDEVSHKLGAHRRAIPCSLPELLQCGLQCSDGVDICSCFVDRLPLAKCFGVASDEQVVRDPIDEAVADAERRVDEAVARNRPPTPAPTAASTAPVNPKAALPEELPDFFFNSDA